jgi:hypothetical protein
MFNYDVVFSDGRHVKVDASSTEQARNKAYRIDRSGTIVDVITVH